jgi:L-threonylcarbamoyladenylate synthase
MRVFQDVSDPQLVELLKNGAVGALPTDTVYGLVGRAADEPAVARLYAVKSGAHEPGAIIAADIQQLAGLGIRARYLHAVERFWPGPISIVIPVAGLGYLRQEAKGLAVRVPSGEKVRGLLTQTGPLLTTDASSPGGPAANTIAEAQHYFGDGLDFYVDGGDLSVRLPATLIRIVDDAIEVIREGAVIIDETGNIVD